MTWRCWPREKFYNSQELDKETNFYYYNARHYDPQIARFVTADTVIDGDFDTQGWNRYMYVKGRPIIGKDPTGHDAVVLQAEEGAAGAGHTGMLVETGENEWTYYSREGEGKYSSGSEKGDHINPKGLKFKSPEEFFKKQEAGVETRNKLEKIKESGGTPHSMIKCNH